MMSNSAEDDTAAAAADDIYDDATQAAPVVIYQCANCLAIVGDIWAQTAASQELQMICLSSKSAVVLCCCCLVFVARRFADDLVVSCLYGCWLSSVGGRRSVGGGRWR